MGSSNWHENVFLFLASSRPLLFLFRIRKERITSHRDESKNLRFTDLITAIFFHSKDEAIDVLVFMEFGQMRNKYSNRIRILAPLNTMCTFDDNQRVIRRSTKKKNQSHRQMAQVKVVTRNAGAEVWPSCWAFFHLIHRMFDEQSHMSA